MTGETCDAAAALAPQIVVVCADGKWCGHAKDRDHGDRLRRLFDEQPAACGPHRVEKWTKLDADEAMEANHAGYGRPRGNA